MNILANETVQEFLEDKLAVLGAMFFVVAVCLAIYPDILAYQNPYDLAKLNLDDSLLPPDGRFWLGTDEQGRDIFSAILYGIRVSLFVGVAATLISSAIGLAAGILAATGAAWWTSSSCAWPISSFLSPCF